MMRVRMLSGLTLLALLAGCQMPSAPGAPEEPPRAPAASLSMPAGGRSWTPRAACSPWRRCSPA